MKVIVGLGNPGKKYEMTRHNMGFLVVASLAKQLALCFREEKQLLGHSCKAKVEGEEVFLLLPTTFVNDSGLSVRRTLDYYKLTPADLIVVSDDIALPFGNLRLRDKGSAGGHNGLKSIEAHLGTREYARLKMGIGDREEGALTDHVLGKFSSEELKELAPFIDKGVAILIRFIKNKGNPASGAGETE